MNLFDHEGHGGAFVLWVDYGTEGWLPYSFDTVDEAIEGAKQAMGDWTLTETVKLGRASPPPERYMLASGEHGWAGPYVGRTPVTDDQIAEMSAALDESAIGELPPGTRYELRRSIPVLIDGRIRWTMAWYHHPSMAVAEKWPAEEPGDRGDYVLVAQKVTP